jgi:hypothetical protein
MCIRSLWSTVAAQYLEQYPNWTPAQVRLELETNALHGQIKNLPRSTKNLLLNLGDLLDR